MSTETEINMRAMSWFVKRYGSEQIAAVEKVEAHGTDWAGDTDGGFYCRCGVTIRWRDKAGSTHYKDVEGEEFPDFWNWMLA